MNVTAKTDLEGQPRKICMQLPDLLSICRPFELRVNHHCQLVSQASEQWLAESGIALRSTRWSAVKVGLLAAACYPDADSPQLRLMTDVISLLLYYYDLTAFSPSPEVVRPPIPEEQDMFSLLSERLSRTAYRNPEWYMRLHKSQRMFLAARHRWPAPTVGDLEGYTAARRVESGFLIALDMIEYARDLTLPQSILEDELLQKLRDHACDIAVLSEDIVSCAKGISWDRRNVVNILRRAEGASLESALAMTGAVVSERVGAFEDAECTLLKSLANQTAKEDVRIYVKALRNWVAGFVNWLYETQRYLDEKGSQVRAFGWVFMPIDT